jgi:predicted AlkP superfamily pyrophosphatase or phosphodiesterase
VEKSPKAKTTTFVICGDHGFFPIQRDIRPNILLRKLGLIESAEGKVTKKTAYCVSQGGACMVYILDDARRAEIAKQLRRLFPTVEGIQAVIGTEKYTEFGQPTPEQNPHGADLWLSAKTDYNFTDSITGDEIVVGRTTVGGTHGYLPDQPDMLAGCIAWGPGVKAGTQLGKVNIIDIAPTIARILQVEMPSAEGKPLTGIVGR